METIRTQRVSDAIATRIEKLILEGALRPGEKLASERELSQRLDVSRPSLREAIDKLVDRGLLTASRGGTSVAQFLLPMMAPLLAVIGLLRLIDAFKVFDTIFILTRGGPGTATESPSLLAYKMTFDFWNIGEASALAVFVWLIFFIACNIFYQIAKKKLNAF